MPSSMMYRPNPANTNGAHMSHDHKKVIRKNGNGLSAFIIWPPKCFLIIFVKKLGFLSLDIVHARCILVVSSGCRIIQYCLISVPG